MDDLSRDELIEKLEAMQPEFEKIMRQFGAHEPDWDPLKLVFGSFMFMGYCDGIRMYQHRFTRRYLHLDEHGAAYRWLGGRERYEQIPLERAIAFAFEDAEALMGWLRPSEDSRSSPMSSDPMMALGATMYIDIHRETDTDIS